MLKMTRAPRGLVHFENMGFHFVKSFLIVAAATAAIYSQQEAILSIWQQAFALLAGLVGLPGTVAMSCLPLDLSCSDAATLTGYTLPAQTLARTLVSLGLAAALLLLSFVVSPFKVPLRYGLRIFATFIGLPSLLLLVIPEHFTADMARHIGQVLHTGYLFLLMMPAILGFTGFIFPGSVLKKAGVLVSAMAYFAILVPVLAVLHLIALNTLGQGFLPFLNIFGTTLLYSFELVAFYGMLASQD